MGREKERERERVCLCEREKRTKRVGGVVGGGLIIEVVVCIAYSGTFLAQRCHGALHIVLSTFLMIAH